MGVLPYSDGSHGVCLTDAVLATNPDQVVQSEWGDDLSA